jgi:hypothetical protein
VKQLPVGIQNFRKIIEGSYTYADKTEYIYKLIKSGSYYFLSRPRRFGKSLLIDTMRELFSGSRDLFEGLWIAKTDYDFTPYPVVRIDMSQTDTSSAAMLEQTITNRLLEMAFDEDVSITGASASDHFIHLIMALRKKYGSRVVVLIDEYDKPIIDHIAEAKLAEANREVLRNFYGILKGQDANLRFAFLTGVSKFTKTSIFSQLNNLIDISLWDPFASICGITEAEFDTLFDEHLRAFHASLSKSKSGDAPRPLSEIRATIFDWYDGYTWDGATRVFNPFSLLSFFLKGTYGNYWYASGTPQFLAEALKMRPVEYLGWQEAIIDEFLLDSHDIENAPLVSLLFQTGFLTVRSADPGPPRSFSIGFPNIEVAQSFGRQFLAEAVEEPDPYGNAFIAGMRKALDTGDAKAFEAGLRGLYASIPYQLHISAEAFYQVVFLSAMQFLGFRVIGELSTAKGRMDGSIERPNGMAYVAEFKYRRAEADASSGQADNLLDGAIIDALAQIDARSYAERYAGTGRRVHKLAIAVSGRGDVRVAIEPAGTRTDTA